MKNFVEYTLPYKLTWKDQCLRILGAVLPMTIGIWLIMLLGLIGAVFCGVLCYVAYRLYISYHYEYEFSLVEDEIHFAKIINLERRKELLKANIGKTESYGPLENMPKTTCKVCSFLTHQGEEPEYYWITYTEKGEKICVLFQPKEEVLEVFSVRARGKLR